MSGPLLSLYRYAINSFYELNSQCIEHIPNAGVKTVAGNETGVLTRVQLGEDCERVPRHGRVRKVEVLVSGKINVT